jgi:hypothetical protein
MSVDLASDAGGEMDFPNAAWRRLLTLAEAHGFQPEAPSGDGAYSAEDARALADALQRAMGTGNDDEVAGRVSRELTRLLVTPSDSPMFPDDPVPFEARAVSYWKQFIAFARRGGFSVS